MRRNTLNCFALFLVLLSLVIPQNLAAANRASKKPAPSKRSTAKSTGARSTTAARAATSTRRSSTARSTARRTVSRYSPWKVPTFADSTEGDWVEGEDSQVRQAAVSALGPYNGTVVVVDPFTGRILSLVNQKLALQSGFQPCSTIKIVAALAALSEGIVERETRIRLTRRTAMNLTEALAVSNNAYFASLGEKLGFERVSYYARLFGLGEKSGLNIEGEQPGILPEKTPAPGMGMMTSFGSGIGLTPLNLAALLSAVANGGTLYYLQHPRNQDDVNGLVPRVKRHLDLEPWIPEVKPGMQGAVLFGTARRAGVENSDPILGKTGTCTDERTPTHLGWFGSFNEVGRNKLVVVVLLTGGKPVSGPVASGIAGAVYRNLSQQNYFAQSRHLSPSTMIEASSFFAH